MENNTDKLQSLLGTFLGVLITVIIYGMIAIFLVGFFVLAYFTIFK